MFFVAEELVPSLPRESGRAVRIARALCGRINRTLGALPYQPLQLRGRLKSRKTRSTSGVSGCLPYFRVGFPPAPLFQLLNPTTLTVLTTSNHFVPHLSCKSLIVKQKLEG